MSSAPLHISVWQCDPIQELEATSQVALQSQDKLLFCCFPICKGRIVLSQLPCVAMPDRARVQYRNASVNTADLVVIAAAWFLAC